MHAVEAIAYNAAQRALLHEHQDRLIQIPWFVNWTRNLYSWENFEPLTGKEREARRQALKSKQKPLGRGLFCLVLTLVAVVSAALYAIVAF